jgi:sugar lactone lactonase YvrE
MEEIGMAKMLEPGRALGALMALSSLACAQPYVISTVAGADQPATSPVPGLNFTFGTVWGIGADAKGNAYIASSDLSSVFRLDPNGLVIRIAGTAWAGFSGDSGPAAGAQLNDPRGVAIDAVGNIFIADFHNARIRKVSPDGVVSTVAGTGSGGFSGDGGPAINAQFASPFAVAVDGGGDLFVADIYGSRVRKISSAGIISTIAGDGSYQFSGDGGPASAAQLNAPTGVAVDSAGNVYIADFNNRRIRKVSADGTMSTFAGGGADILDGVAATAVRLTAPLGVAVDGAGNVFIADEYTGIRKVSPDGIITTVAGGGQNWGSAADGGPATSAAILPFGVAVDASGTLSFIDNNLNRIRKVSPDGIITTAAGGPCCFSGDGGPAINAQLNDPASVAVDAAGNLLIADSKNLRIRKISADGTIATVANACFYPDDVWAACGLAVDATGNIYASDDNGVFKVSSDGSSTKVADGAFGLVVDGAGNLYLAEEYAPLVLRVSRSGVTTVVAGTGTPGFSGDDGPANAAQLNLPVGLALDQNGNLYIADSGNKRIRMVSSSGVITTVADLSADLSGYFPGQVIDGLIAGLAVDSVGNIFVEEYSPAFTGIRKISPDGTIKTIAGTGVAGYSGDGGPATSAQLNPSSDELGNTLALDNAGNLYVADGGNRVVRVLRPVNP